MPSKIKEDSKTRIILLRHGESTYNRLGLYQGSCNDSVLTTNGILDAQHTGIYLAELGLNNKNLDLIYSSSLRRSYDTAQEIAQAIANTFEPKIIHTSDLLWETDLPQWRGLGIKYVRKSFPEEYHTWKHNPQDFFMESIERVDNEVDSISRFYPLVDLYSKIRLFWQDLLRNHFGQTILVVAHGGSNRALISAALGIEPKRYHCIQQSNCGISVLQFRGNSLESGQLEAMNLNSHMGYTIPKLQEGAGGIRLLLVCSENDVVNKHKLISCLRNIVLDFSILEEGSNSFHTGQQILKYHSATSQMSANSSNFLQHYTKIIKKRLNISTENKLSNGLVVAELETIKKLIGNILGMSSQNLEKLNLQPGTISAIHYPSVELPPVLQAMNTSESEKYLIHKPEFAQSYLF
ncbi:histidine phosphatase family protein [Mastigocoleus testarum]|uniref:Phosphoglycerate mutase n=1 Tax=Mastigocoleus testarum BC008 TaxID=371196 RepID=A0A0V7ZBL5_9CYAN|nr:histidine phosphatase family protein [Mastigocoleus testarum]KST61917.1 hypothetical protein BC008_07680 [Mastigocoleus testarum BC008]